MPKLQDKVYKKITGFNNKAEQFIDQQAFLNAIKEYQKAWNTLPEPRQLWDAGLWIKVGQAECFLAQDAFQAAKDKLLDAILCAGAVNNPLVHLLLGICYYELNDKDNAKIELQIAYDLEGESVFQEGDEQYRDFLINKKQ